MREKKGSDLLYQQGHSTFASGTKLEVFQDQLFLIMCYSDANECNQEAVTVIIPTMTEIFLKILKGFQVMLKLWDFFFFFFFLSGILFSEDSLLLYKYQQNISFGISTCFLGQRKINYQENKGNSSILTYKVYL